MVKKIKFTGKIGKTVKNGKNENACQDFNQPKIDNSF
jgi:hypothetical protein